MSRQATLLGGGTPAVDLSFSGLVRVELDDRAWVDHAPGWLEGSEAVFDVLVERADWEQHDRLLYGEMRRQPRLNAPWVGAEWLEPAVPVLSEARQLLSERYGVDLDSGGLNLYRDGRDSVAWHRDKIPAAIIDPVVAIISLGAPRRFLLRPRGGGRSVRFDLGSGDLLVTGGSTQRTWEHTVPKVAAADPRISLTFRHSRSAG
jgi:alkylated DNA repair dioxygenase AlkB